MIDPALTGALIELVGAAVLLFVAAVAIPWMRELAAKAKTERVRAASSSALDVLERIVPMAVRATEQTVAKRLRATSPGIGDLLPAQAAEAVADATARVLEHLGEARLDELAQALGLRDRTALEPVIRARIEAAVLDLKSAPLAPG